MAGTLVGAVYGTVSLIVRRVIVPDNDSELDDPALLRPGESLLKIAGIDRPTLDIGQLVKATQAFLGTVASGRCAVIDKTNTVTQIISADPLLDSIPGMTIVASDTAQIGNTFLNGVFSVVANVLPGLGGIL